MNDPEDIDRVLRDSNLWFIVGLGDNPDRAAFSVAQVWVRLF